MVQMQIWFIHTEHGPVLNKCKNYPPQLKSMISTMSLFPFCRHLLSKTKPVAMLPLKAHVTVSFLIHHRRVRHAPLLSSRVIHRFVETTLYALMVSTRHSNAQLETITIQCLKPVRTARRLRQLRAAIAARMRMWISSMLPVHRIAAPTTTATVTVREEQPHHAKPWAPISMKPTRLVLLAPTLQPTLSQTALVI